MARVGGPLFSKSASGTVADVITFSSSKGVAVCKIKPDNDFPASSGQQIQQAKYSAGVSFWNSLSEPEQEQYSDLAKGQAKTGFNLFMSDWLLDKIPIINYGNYGNTTYGNCVYV